MLVGQSHKHAAAEGQSTRDGHDPPRKIKKNLVWNGDATRQNKRNTKAIYAGEGKAGGRYIPVLRWIRPWVPVAGCHDLPFHTDNACSDQSRILKKRTPHKATSSQVPSGIQGESPAGATGAKIPEKWELEGQPPQDEQFWLADRERCPQFYRGMSRRRRALSKTCNQQCTERLYFNRQGQLGMLTRRINYANEMSLYMQRLTQHDVFCTCCMWWFSRILLQLRSSGRGSRWTSAFDRILRISLTLTIWQTYGSTSCKRSAAPISLSWTASLINTGANKSSNNARPSAKTSSAF